jgi:hypothetical protein
MAAAAAACFPNVKQLTVHGCSFSGPTLCHVLDSLPSVQSVNYCSGNSSQWSSPGPDDQGCLGVLLDTQHLQRLSFTGPSLTTGPPRPSPQPIVFRQLGGSLTHLTLKHADVKVLGRRLAGSALQFFHADSMASAQRHSWRTTASRQVVTHPSVVMYNLTHTLIPAAAAPSDPYVPACGWGQARQFLRGG